MRTTWTFHGPGKVIFGRDSIGQLRDIAGQMESRKVLVVTDSTLASAGVVERVTEHLAAANVGFQVFDGGQPDPPLHAVESAAALARDFQPDVLLGLGGGSNMDLTKATAAVLAHGGSCKSYAGDEVVPGPVFPMILVPTTSGTGSEVTAAAVLNDTDEGTKFGILSNYLRPRVALIDPMLTVSCPPSVTADSGIDALTHAVEAYTGVDNETFPLPSGEKTVYQGRCEWTDILAERAIGLIGQHLRRAVSDGDDLEAREGMSLAATTAGMSFSNCGVGVVHALEYALGPVAHISHGRGCGLLLPYVMRFNAPARADRLRRIAELLGEDLGGITDESAALTACDAVERLKHDIGIPARLSDVGVVSDNIPAMAEKAFGVKRILRMSPRPVTQQDLEQVLTAAL